MEDSQNLNNLIYLIYQVVEILWMWFWGLWVLPSFFFLVDKVFFGKKGQPGRSDNGNWRNKTAGKLFFFYLVIYYLVYLFT